MALPNTQRGRGRGRGAQRGYPSTASFTASLPAPAATQNRLQVIPSSTLLVSRSSSDTLRIKEARCVASYNWVDENSSTILVPGKPPKWHPPVGRQQLQEDNGQYYRDPNGARFSTYPTEPAVRAVYELNPDFDPSHVDIFGCGSTIGSLLSFVNHEERTFRFGIERIGNTVFLVRKTNTPNELITNVRGYGHSFPEAYTMWESDVKGSSSHQRIIHYDFAGLQCMVRSESDGYLPTLLSTAGPETGLTDDCKQQVDHRTNAKSKLEDNLSLSDAFSALGRSHLSSKQSGKLIVQKAGRPVEQRAIFDLKTRSMRRMDDIDLSEFLPRLWANQTFNFILAWHNAGSFEQISVKGVEHDIMRWEQKNQKVLAKFHLALTKLCEFSNTHTRFEVRRTEKGPLEIWSEVAGWSALPSELRIRWQGEVSGYGQDGEKVLHDSENTAGLDDYLLF